MDSNYKPYDYEASFDRIDQVLEASSDNYQEVDSLPDRDRLTFTNGFYAYCSALFIDIRDSSSLPIIYKRPRLAKLYRAFISEMVAIFNSDPFVREVNIVGDCVWAVYNTPKQTDIDDIFRLAYTANSLVKTLNYKLTRAGFEKPIRCGIGMSYGRALMIKAGFNGSGINDVVYMGDVVNQAAKLAAEGSKGWQKAIQMDDVFYQNLNDHNKSLMRRVGYSSRYEGDVIHTAMDAWHDLNCT
jgi:class 3 adenylate cyclase